MTSADLGDIGWRLSPPRSQRPETSVSVQECGVSFVRVPLLGLFKGGGKARGESPNPAKIPCRGAQVCVMRWALRMNKASLPSKQNRSSVPGTESNLSNGLTWCNTLRSYARHGGPAARLQSRVGERSLSKAGHFWVWVGGDSTPSVLNVFLEQVGAENCSLVLQLSGPIYIHRPAMVKAGPNQDFLAPGFHRNKHDFRRSTKRRHLCLHHGLWGRWRHFVRPFQGVPKHLFLDASQGRAIGGANFSTTGLCSWYP